MVLFEALEFHKVNLEFLRLSHLDSEKVQEFILLGCFSHSMDDFLPPIEKGFKVIILEFELIQYVSQS